jgi:hypothetical protein
LSCSVKNGNRIVPINGKYIFRVKYIPEPIAKVGGQVSNASITKGLLLASNGVASVMVNFDFDIKVMVNSFTVTTQDSTTFYSATTNQGPLFSNSQLNLLKKLQENDKVIIEDIKVNMPDGTTRTLAPLVLTIKN